jgi:hypothetical protein
MVQIMNNFFTKCQHMYCLPMHGMPITAYETEPYHWELE